MQDGRQEGQSDDPLGGLEPGPVSAEGVLGQSGDQAAVGVPGQPAGADGESAGP